MLRQRQVNGPVTQNGKDQKMSTGMQVLKKLPTVQYLLLRAFLWYMFVGFVVFVFVIVPLMYCSCSWFRRNMIYLNLVNPSSESLSNPTAAGLECARNFYLPTDPGIQIGVWHVLPQSRWHLCQQPSDLKSLEFNDSRPVFMHLHGSGGHRGARHRIKLMKTLSSGEIDAHVVTLDYRGFGDSTYARTSVQGIVQDVSTLYRWIRQRVAAERITLWGQSLGTGIAVHLADSLDSDDSPLALVLEAPYTTMAEASRNHPYTLPYRFYPFYDAIFVDPVRSPDTNYDSESRIGNISSAILILHAQDDETIPYFLGKLLYETALLKRDPVSQPTEMVTYEANLGYGHKHICSDPAVPEMINAFLKKATVLRTNRNDKF